MDALGIASMSRREVSRICAALDAEVAAFRGRSLADERHPYLFLDATYVKVRDGGRVVSMAALVAVGVTASGERRILGLELAAGNDQGNAWAGFLRGLVERGLWGVRLVISDAHRGLVAAVREMLLGAAWQRCRVHFTRNAQALVWRGGHGRLRHPQQCHGLICVLGLEGLEESPPYDFEALLYRGGRRGHSWRATTLASRSSAFSPPSPPISIWDDGRLASSRLVGD